MLVLSRRSDEEIVIGGEVRIKVFDIQIKQIQN
ncbi:MAG: carbon storage regulator [Pirellulales bacterium]|nr:carbon storage regulator [Pirellulales bacterium]